MTDAEDAAVRTEHGSGYVRLVPRDEEAHRGVVDLLERMLEMARTYRLVAVGVVTVNDDGSTGTAWANGGQHYQKLHSAVHTLAVRMASEGY